MTWNGSGLYERLYNWVTDRDAATPIDATKMDAEQDGIVGALNDIVQQNEPFQGPILAQDGTVSSPGYTFDSDLDLGMYRVGLNSGALVAGSAAPLTWTATKVVLLGLDIDTIAESTPAAGVTIDGVLLKDSAVTTDTIAEKTPAAGVTIDSVLLKDGGLEATGTITGDTIAEKTPAAGVTIDGLLIKDGSIELDTIAESTPAAGVTVDGLLIKDGALGTSSSVPTAAIADNAVTLAKLAAGTDGELITWDAAGDPATVAVGTATHVLTSNGAGAAPTFQAPYIEATAAQIRDGSASVLVTPANMEAADAPVALTDAATVAVDWDAGGSFTLAIGGNRTLGTPTNGVPGQWRVIEVTQTTGSHTLGTSAAYKTPGAESIVLSTGASERDRLYIYCVSASEFDLTWDKDFS
jgi:hypothetical protein